MRAPKITLLLFAVLVLVRPAPAQAWFGWIDELSGPGKFRGLEFEFRLVCFGEKSHASQLINQLVIANDLTNKLSEKNVSFSFAGAEAAWRDVIDTLNRSQLTFPVLDRKAVSTVTGDIKTQLQTLRTALEAKPIEPEASQSDIQKPLTTFLAAVQKDAESVDLFSTEEARAAIATGSTGVLWSVCSDNKERRSSIELGVNFWHADANPSFANNNEIRLTTLMPMYSFRVFPDPRYDVLDAGVGAGVYWFTSAGFDSFSGVILQPGRLDFHAPTVWSSYNWKQHAWQRIAAVPAFRYDVMLFPAGFPADAFAGVGVHHVRIPGELVPSWSIFINLAPFLPKGPYVTSRN